MREIETTVLLERATGNDRYIYTAGALVDPGHPETGSGYMILGRHTGVVGLEVAG